VIAMSTPQDPYNQQGQPGYGQQQPPYPQPGYQQYPQQQYSGYAAPAKKALDVVKLVTIGAWVVLGLHAVAYLYWLTQDDEFSPDFADRFLGNLPTLGQGIFGAGVLLALGVLLQKRQADG
jgi:hypothetical protein